MTKALHTHVRPDKVRGHTLSRVHLAHDKWRPVKSGTKVPDSSKLFNFNLKAGDQTLLVLDNYGNELLPDKMERRLVQSKKFAYTLAIDRKTGIVYLASFGKEKNQYIAIISPLDLGFSHPMFKVPASFLKHLDQLKSAKRPYHINLNPVSILAFVIRERGYDGLREGLEISLNFGEERVDLDAAGNYRVTTRWKAVNS